MKRAGQFVIAGGFACLLLAGGCYLGDATAHKTVAITLPMPRNGTSLSVNVADVQQALELIDSVLVSNGYPRDRGLPPEDQARGLVASYGICGVTLKGRTLAAGCVGAHESHLSPPLERTMDQLQDALTRRYGPAGVTVEE